MKSLGVLERMSFYQNIITMYLSGIQRPSIKQNVNRSTPKKGYININQPMLVYERISRTNLSWPVKVLKQIALE